MRDLENHTDDSADTIATLITTYNDLNPTTIQSLSSEPSPLEFMRFVARNTPFVIRGGALDWNAVKAWTPEFLQNELRGHQVKVAITPNGKADAPTILESTSKLVFAKPCEEDEDFCDALEYIRRQELDPSFSGAEIKYAQTQNDNLRHEYISLFSHVQPDIPFARVALEKEPEAINLWIGNSKSTTALHRDPYENIYVQIKGYKHFVLLPGLCQPCVNEQSLRPATYIRSQDGHVQLHLDAAIAADDDDVDNVPFATWDPDESQQNTTKYSHLAQPVRVTLEPGDMLYLPAMWYHKVSQSCSEDGMCIAANYWYDMDYGGPFYPLTNFVRSVAQTHG